ncbi:MAG: fluoride efflux transporter CrcB [Saprospiraceae bacterium]|nr:fluoride efflux transporter CrcB [Bacteroidia bacterium]NNE13694.1 fluoride efflux transporter CrcB [Saprospiraceae bacterium]NNL90797.1 fluoride efflux transporter CrcB [Saprospiraceae bacterium]
MAAIYVFIGGGLGALSRFGISKIIDNYAFPYATLIANIISCIILGYLMGAVLQKSLDQKLQLLLMTGFCGGFSTFSTYSAESFRLLQNNQYGAAFIYIFGSILICLICIWAGIKLYQ